MTFNEFSKKYLGKGVDYDGSYGNQCVDLFRQYNKEVLEIKQPKGVIGAVDFYTKFESDPVLVENFTKIPNTPTGVPQEGDVIIWDKWTGNPYGHVAMFIKGDVNKFTSLDQNWNNVKKVQEIEHSYTKPKVLGWLRPMTKKETCEVLLGEMKIRYAELQTKYDKDIKALNKANNDKTAEINSLREQLNNLEDDTKENIQDMKKTIETLQEEVSKKQLEINELARLNEALLEETKLWNAFKRAVSSLKDKYVSKI